MVLALVSATKLCSIRVMTHTNSISAIFRKLTLGTALSLSAFSFASANEVPSTVVELFTSQGCSSCPPANEFVGKLSEDKNVLALTYGVTYWDYLGWRDTFADPEFTKRQRDYGEAFGIGNVYTPQIVLNGSAHSPRYSKTDVKTMTLEPATLSAEFTLSEDAVSFTASQDVVVVTFKPGWQEVPVKAGENHGRTLRLANVVTDVTPLKSGEIFENEMQAGLAYAALVHDPKTMKVTTAKVFQPK